MPTAPQTTWTLDQLPEDARERKEAMLDIFGQHLFWLRNQRLRVVRHLVASATERERLGTIRRRPYEAMASHGDAAAHAAIGVAQAALDLYIQDLLALLTNIGDDMRFGAGHSLRYKLVLEVIDVVKDAVAQEETINRDTQDWLPGYFGRWLNRYKSYPVEPKGE